MNRVRTLLASIVIAVLVVVLALGSSSEPRPAIGARVLPSGGATTPAASTSATSSSFDPAKYVNPFVGTAAGGENYGTGGGAGNTFPGADVPFGMVQWSPDTSPTQPGGYVYGGNLITGFSLTHLSGAGCPAYGDFPFLPATGRVERSPGDTWESYAGFLEHSAESASPGYYSIQMQPSGVRAELTVTQRAGFGRFTYPRTRDALMLVNADGSANGSTNPSVEIIGDRELAGTVTSGHFCDSPGTYTVHFYARFDRAFSSYGVWSGSRLYRGERAVAGERSGAYVGFDTRSNPRVQMKVGLSFVSRDNARLNLDREEPGWSFDVVRRAARASWNRLLGEVRVSGGTEDQRQIFYTALYHALLQPNVFSDANGQYVGFDGRVHVARGYTQYANFSGWDIYRSEVQLLALLAPKQTSDMMQSLVSDAREGGWLPKWGLANDYTGVMVGDPADAIIASAYAFGARDFDARAALGYMLKGATRTGHGQGWYVERPGLEEYLRLGYVPSGTEGVWGSAATTLEYTTADFAIAQLARRLGDMATYREYARRAGNWRNLFNPTTGYIEPRDASGSFPRSYDPASTTEFVEGNGAQYTWMVPYDLAGLFRAMGGREVAARRLNAFFRELNAGPERPYAFLGNEPTFETPWEYDYAGVPWLTQKVVRRAANELFGTGPSGPVGNDDLGASSSWYVWAALGLYPEVPGTSDLVIGSPLFPEAQISLPHGKEIVIRARGAGSTAPYVRSLRVDGKAYDRSWIPGSKLLGGGRLDFVLATRPNRSWATAPGSLPPSYPNGR